MTRFRKTSGTAGRVVFVGAGPGDPGMLTARATAALTEAAVVLVDPDVSVAVQDAVREAHPQAELSAAAGEPAEVAKAAVTAAKNGASSSGWSPATRTPPTRWSRRCSPSAAPRCRSTSCPASPPPPPCPPYAGVALGSTAVTADLRSGVDVARAAPARSPPAARWCCRAAPRTSPRRPPG